MLLADRLVEAQLAAAIRRGDFDNLAGAGEPLRLDDDSAVPESLRTAYRMLANAGCLPPELSLRKEIQTLEALLNRAEDCAEHNRLRRRLALLRARLERHGHRVDMLAREGEYREKLLARLGAAARGEAG